MNWKALTFAVLLFVLLMYLAVTQTTMFMHGDAYPVEKPE
jgi:hypothetical protein